MSFENILFVGATGLVAGVLSGMSGGGGGMLMIPAFIAIGLPPQNAVATGKMNGLGATVGGLSVFARSGHIRRDIVKVMAPIAVVIGLALPFVFSKIDSEVFQRLIGFVILLLIPMLFLKKKAQEHHSKARKKIGYILYSGILAMQALFGSGVGSLANFILVLLFGTSRIEANATKRAITAVLIPITFTALLIGGYVNLVIGFVGMVSMFVGTHYGSKIAIAKGELFATYSLAFVASLSALFLIFSA